MAKNKTVKSERPKFKDIITLASAGWTPGQVNELLDRFDSLGDLNAPDPTDEDDEDDEEALLVEADDEDIDIEDEDQDESDDNEDDNDTASDNQTSATTKKKNQNKSTLLEAENARLKKQIQKLQQKNRNKDVSGGEDEKPIEKSLIDTFQSIFD